MPVKLQTIWMENNVIMGTFVEKFQNYISKSEGVSISRNFRPSMPKYL